MLPEAIEVYRSARLAECEERSFVLTAVGVPSEILRSGADHVLLVEAAAIETARTHLLRYDEETRPPPRLAPLPLHVHAWAGCALYAAVLIAVAYAIRNGIGPLDAFDAGELHAAAVQHGEWWRAWTALTLHYGLDHLAANLGAGVWFGYLAGRVLGPGTAWALIVNGGACANLIEGLLAPPSHRAAGASTAVFTALGLLAAFSWRERRSLRERWELGWSPLIAGVVLLGWLGTAGAHTDVLAHLLGFLCGALLGTAAAAASVKRLLSRTPQWLGGTLALGAIGLAWLLAVTQ
ncbi:MAG: rhomboid family intramembrane serine protease [Steroidobacteraceae bacterium]